MGLTVKNNGSSELDILEYIVKLTKLAPGESLTIDANTKKLQIGDLEIILS